MALTLTPLSSDPSPRPPLGGEGRRPRTSSHACRATPGLPRPHLASPRGGCCRRDRLWTNSPN